MKKIILLIIVIVISLGILTAQYEWSQTSIGTENNLRTAFIGESGNIFVFGDNAFGAMSNDDGKSWNIIEKIDSSLRTIDFSLELAGGIATLNSNGLRKIYGSYWNIYDAGGRWIDFSIFNNDIESIQRDNLGNIYIFPSSRDARNPIGTLVRREVYNVNGKISYGVQKFYNFYLPGYSYNPRVPNYRYVSGVAGNGQIITFLHHTYPGSQGYLASAFISNTDGEWISVKYNFDETMRYVDQIMFQDSVGFLVGANGGGDGIVLYRSNDNGNSWSLVDKLYRWEDVPRSLSLYHDHHDNVNNAIIVGSIKKNYESRKQGFVKINEQAPVVISEEGLNFITGKNGKFVIVGDKGAVFIGKRDTPSSIKKIYSPENSGEIKLFDISGKLIKTFSGEKSDYEVSSELPIGTYIIKSGHQTRKIIK